MRRDYEKPTMAIIAIELEENLLSTSSGSIKEAEVVEHNDGWVTNIDA